MDNLKKDVGLLLKVLEESVEKLSEQDLMDLIQGKTVLVPKRIDGNTNLADSKYQNIIQKIIDARDRKKAELILLDSKVLKKDLINISEILEVYISKNDTKEKMITKIIEATVGAKSRSIAIKDLNLKKMTRSNG